jgi:predicted CXXCH cytochrome family protein
VTKADADVRRVPLNFPRPAEPPARTPQEWVARRAAFDEGILWNKTCAECHVSAGAAVQAPAPAQTSLPVYAKSNITKQWMPRAAFDHAPHQMVTCESCHAAKESTRTSDVLLPSRTVCATCHAPSRGAESRCFECHRYHDWTKMHPVTSSYSLTEFK